MSPNATTTIEADLAPSARRGLLAFLLLWLCGASLRLTVLAVPPVVPLLHADLHLSETDIGWLSSLPPMLFAVAAVPGAILIALALRIAVEDKAMRERFGEEYAAYVRRSWALIPLIW